MPILALSGSFVNEMSQSTLKKQLDIFSPKPHNGPSVTFYNNPLIPAKIFGGI